MLTVIQDTTIFIKLCNVKYYWKRILSYIIVYMHTSRLLLIMIAVCNINFLIKVFKIEWAMLVLMWLQSFVYLVQAQLRQKYYAPQILPNWCSDPWPPDHRQHISCPWDVHLNKRPVWKFKINAMLCYLSGLRCTCTRSQIQTDALATDIFCFKYALDRSTAHPKFDPMVIALMTSMQSLIPHVMFHTNLP